METKVEGVVIKEFRFKETSKILTIYTDKCGKISVMARGAYNPKSPLIANTQCFSYNEYNIYKGRNLYYINQADIIDSFYPIREDITRMMYGSYILELINLSTVEEDKNERLFILLVKGLNILSQIKKDYLKLILSYELKYISFLGYRPSLDKCIICNRRDFKEIKFSIDKGGIICPNCQSIEPYCEYMNIDMYKAMRALLYTPLDKIFSINISKNTMFKLHRIMVKYILNKIDRKQFNSLNMLNSMEKSGGI